MEMKGEQRIAAPRAKVWEALNDAEVLRQCIPGCQSLEKEGDRMKAVVEIKIGPIGARFNGAVTISDANPPESYTISGEGQGGTVGNAKGGAKVRLAEVDGGTLLSYEVDAQVGGRLAQLGGPIIDATAKQLAGKFFTKFGDVVEGPPAGAPAAAPTAVAGEAPVVASAAAPVAAPAVQYVTASAPAPGVAAGSPWGWIVLAVLTMVVGFYLGQNGKGPEWMLYIVLAVLVAIGVGYECGRRAAGGGR